MNILVGFVQPIQGRKFIRFSTKPWRIRCGSRSRPFLAAVRSRRGKRWLENHCQSTRERGQACVKFGAQIQLLFL